MPALMSLAFASYILFGLVIAAINLDSAMLRKFNGWTHAILAIIVFVAIWPFWVAVAILENDQ